MKDNIELFKIKDLIEKTGVSRQTIHFYLSEGLLQAPQKTSKNMSWYSQEHIERLKQIKELQEKQFLPLKAIKAVLNNANNHQFTKQQQELIFSLKKQLNKNNKAEKQINLKTAISKANISKTEIIEMQQINYISNNKNKINYKDKELIELWINLKELGLNKDKGFSPKDLEIFTEISEIIFNHEFKIFADKLSDLAPDDAFKLINNAVPIVNKIISILHQKKIEQFIDNFSKDKR